MSGASDNAGPALSVAGNRIDISFMPLAVETLGGWSQLAIDTIKSIGRQQGQRLGIPHRCNKFITFFKGLLFRSGT